MSVFSPPTCGWLVPPLSEFLVLRFAVKSVEQAQVCWNILMQQFKQAGSNLYFNQTYWNLLEKVHPKDLKLTK